MNYVAMGLKMAQADFKLGADIMRVTGDYLSSKARSLSLKLQGENLAAAAENALEQAGNTQLQGRQQREKITLQAGQLKGQVTASAAASGMDVSSRVVQKATKDIQKQSQDAAATAAFNEKQAVQNDINQMLMMRQEAVMNRLAQKTEKNNRKMGLISGITTTAMNWVGGMTEAAASLMGGGGFGGGGGALSAAGGAGAAM